MKDDDSKDIVFFINVTLTIYINTTIKSLYPGEVRTYSCVHFEYCVIFHGFIFFRATIFYF